MGTLKMTPELLGLIAERFRALAEPARLQILNALRGGEKTVTQLVEETGLGQANVSKHLQVLHTLGYITRRKQGLFVHVSLTDPESLQALRHHVRPAGGGVQEPEEGRWPSTEKGGPQRPPLQFRRLLPVRDAPPCP